MLDRLMLLEKLPSPCLHRQPSSCGLYTIAFLAQGVLFLGHHLSDSPK